MKSKRAKATDISQKVKKTVYERDLGMCVICNRSGMPNNHYIKRSQGGLGIEQNVVTLCLDCQYEQEHGKNTKKYTEEIKNYLQNYYGTEWKEQDLYYKKYQ